MDIRYDERGKYYTEVIHKNAYRVLICTGQHYIDGEIYVVPGIRFREELDRTEKFIPVTHAKVMDQSHHILWDINFMLLNVAQISWIIPQDELTQTLNPGNDSP